MTPRKDEGQELIGGVEKSLTRKTGNMTGFDNRGRKDITATSIVRIIKTGAIFWNPVLRNEQPYQLLVNSQADETNRSKHLGASVERHRIG